MDEIITLVNARDEIIGYEEKIKVHSLQKLHRAFSVFIYDRDSNQMLIQKRASGKYHSGGLWSNACCSHPRQNESMEEAVFRCLHSELQLEPESKVKIRDCSISQLKLKIGEMCYAWKFMYFHKYKDLAEHEIDYVFVYGV